MRLDITIHTLRNGKLNNPNRSNYSQVIWIQIKHGISSVKPQFFNTGYGSTPQHIIPVAYTTETKQSELGSTTDRHQNTESTQLHHNSSHGLRIEQHEFHTEIRGQTKQLEPVATTRTHQACNLYPLGQSCSD